MKNVRFDTSTKDNLTKRPCECQCCKNCRTKLIEQKKQYCETFGSNRCEECKEWRCDSCFKKNVCNYCLRQ